MSTPKNNIVRSVTPKSIFPSAQAVISAAVSFNQGDLLVFDDSANLLKVPSAESEGSTFLGVATETIVLGVLQHPYSTPVDASAAITDVPGPAYSVVAALVLKTGSSLSPGDLVYLDPSSGAQNVQPTGTKAIGIYQGKTISSSSAGQLVEVLLGCRHPGDALEF